LARATTVPGGFVSSSGRHKVDICVFTITDNRISSAISDAHRRGVRVRIITDNDKVHDAGSDIQELASAGIPIKVDRTQYHMHHKFALFDGNRLLTGSYNWTRGAAEYNEENFVVTSNPDLVNPFNQVFEQLWQDLPDV
jgi:cardiolipin hydrolase